MSKIVSSFYSAFKALDSEKMVSFYHPDIEFEDPAFGKLKGEKANNMWRMLIESQQGQDFLVEFSNVKEDNENASAKWEAHYIFSKTGRKVHNRIEAEFKLKDGLIIKHTDIFDLHGWAKQALGFKGLLLGGSAFFKKKLNGQTNYLLQKFEERRVSKKI